MRFFLDHDVPRHLADVLRCHGHEVELVSDVMSLEADDEKVFAYASKNEAVMYTCNRIAFLSLAAAHSNSGLTTLICCGLALSEAGCLLGLLGPGGPKVGRQCQLGMTKLEPRNEPSFQQ